MSKRKIKNRSISRELFMRMLVIITTFSTLSIIYFIYSEFKDFEKEKALFKENYYSIQKEYIKSQVDNAVSFVNYYRETADQKLKNKLNDRTNLAFQIADDIYNTNKGKISDERIKILIREALRPIRFENTSAYFFIGNFNGTDELYPVAPEFEGKNLINLQDEKGNYVMQDEIKVAKSSADGGFVTHYWRKPGDIEGMIYPKLSYVRTFEPLNWYIGTGEYIDDFTTEIQGEILDRLAKIRFGNEGYVFVNSYQGKPLITDGKLVEEDKNIWELEDPNGVKVIQEERAAVNNPNGDFIYYVWNKLSRTEPAEKISFIKGIPEWEWMIGAGVYVDEVEEQIANLSKKHNTQITTNLLMTIAVIVLIYLFLFILVKHYAEIIRENVKKLNFFFSHAAGSLNKIVLSNIQFSEFKEIADSANIMIQKRNDAEKKLRIEKTHFENLFENAPAAIMILNKDSKVDKINKKFEQVFGVANDQLLGKHVNKCLPFSSITENFNSFFESIKQKGVDFTQLFIDQNKTGLHKIFSVAGNSISIGDEYLGIYLLFQDITDEFRIKENLKLAKEKAEESDHLKSKFLANMSHEIRTPMNGILGFAQVLKQSKVSEEKQLEFLNIIENSGFRMLNIINDIVDISKLEAGQVDVKLSDFNLNEQVELLINFLKPEANKKGVALIEKSTVARKTVFVHSDKEKVYAILLNLAKNAIKFTENGLVEIYFEKKSTEIEFSVKDTGKGIAPEKQDVIFDRFTQANMETDKVYEGSGLGLAISKAYVELLGGKIWFHSELGKGTDFHFTIPVDYQQINKL